MIPSIITILSIIFLFVPVRMRGDVLVQGFTTLLIIIGLVILNLAAWITWSVWTN